MSFIKIRRRCEATVRELISRTKAIVLFGYPEATIRATSCSRGLSSEMGALACVTRDPALMPLVLVARLAALAEAVAELRRVQQHAAQADAARTAAQRLHAASEAVSAAAPAGDPRPRATRRPADTSFPEPFRFVPRKPPTPPAPLWSGQPSARTRAIPTTPTGHGL